MSPIRQILLGCGLCAALLGCVSGVSAAPALGSGFAQQQRATEPKARDRDEAAALARQRSGGRVLSSDADEEDGRPVYRVKVLTPEGRVRVLVIEANGGPRSR